MVFSFIFSVIYYLITYWFISDQDGVIDKLGKILLPILIVAVTFIIVKGFITPLGQPTAKVYSENPFAYGFVGGYATREIICALMFGSIIINSLKSKGIGEKYLNKNLIICCVIGVGILTISHFGHVYIGSQSGGMFPELKYSALYTAVVMKLWGTVGGILFNVGLLFAALTTAVGMSAGTADFVVEISDEKITYKKACIWILIASAIVSTIGLSTIVEVIGPLMDIIYPAAIILVLFYSIFPKFENNHYLWIGYKLSMYFAFAWGIYGGVIAYMKMFGKDPTALINLKNLIPLENFNLGYLTVSIIIMVICLIMSKVKPVDDRIIEDQKI